MDSESNPVNKFKPEVPRAQRREDALKSLGTAPFIDLTDDDNPPWEHLEVRPQSLILSSSTARSYTLKSGGWTDDDDNTSRLHRTRVDLRSIIEVVLRPGIGYPVSFRVSREEGGPFTGQYGEEGTATISVSPETVEAMIRQPWGVFLASVWGLQE